MSTNTVKMPGASNIGGIQALRDTLFFAMSQHDHIVLDASKVKKSDTATLQVLASLAATLEAKGGKLEWSEKSIQINEQAKLLGMEELLRLS